MRIKIRRTAGCLAGAVALSLAGCGDSEQSSAPTDTAHGPTTSSNADPTENASPPTSEPTPQQPDASAADCPEQTLGQLTLAERVGQLFMGGVQVGESPPLVSDNLGEANVGSILFFGQLTGGTAASADAADEAREVAGSPAEVRPFVAVDQEGGQVQHLKGDGFSTMPSAREQAEMTPEQLREEAATWGEELRAGGMDVNLAPVADVVPEEIGTSNEPIAAVDRGYGSDAAAVSEHVVAYVQGMADAGVGTSVKHFPGLGKVEGNTDYSSGVLDSLTARDDPDLAPFEAGLDAGADFLMMATATYELIDPEQRAAFSPVVLEAMVRDDLGFDGVVMSDDLGMAEEVADVPPGDRALNFFRAGGDIAIVATPEILPEMTQAVIDEVGDDPEFAEDIDQSVLRVLIAKDRMGLLGCS